MKTIADIIARLSTQRVVRVWHPCEFGDGYDYGAPDGSGHGSGHCSGDGDGHGHGCVYGCGDDLYGGYGDSNGYGDGGGRGGGS